MILSSIFLSACATAEFYRQAVVGHASLTFKKKNIKRILARPDIKPDLKQKLLLVQSIRQFAIEQLSLPDNGSYTQYVDLQRDAVVWIVSAAPEFSLQAKRWCYPIAGCVSYRGYFSKSGAQRYARKLMNTSYETSITQSLAYSTLGWQKDPVLSTMLERSDLNLAGVLFHELAHQKIYLKGDTAFSEAFASAVETIGKQRWAQAHGLQQELEQFQQHQIRLANYQQQFTQLVLNTRLKLIQLYDQELDEATKRDLKRQQFRQLHESYLQLKNSWDGYRGYDNWFADPGPNNADLALISSYESDKPAFLVLYLRLGCQLDDFFNQVQTLSELNPSQRAAQFTELNNAASTYEPTVLTNLEQHCHKK